jgi:hypothetical protein
MPTTQGPGILIPVILSDGETNAGWKQVPTPAERESMRDDWKKY